MASHTLAKPHGINSTTFKQPPLDFSLNLPELFEWHLDHSRDHPLFVFEESPGSIRTINWGEGLQGIHRATKYVRDTLQKPLVKDENGKPPVVAVLASSDTITFFTLIVGALRTGSTLFLISPRNSDQAIADLLKRIQPNYLLISSEVSLHDLLSSSLDLLPKNHGIEVFDMPVFEDLFPTRGFDPSFERVPMADIKLDDPAMILHSSGTTAFPKPITWNHRTAVVYAISACFGEVDFCGNIVACHAVPMFHGMGQLLTTCLVGTGMIVAVFKPQSPAVKPNPTNVLEGTIATKSDYVFLTPTFIETWSHDPKSVEVLSKMKGAIYGGGPLDKHAGDHLASKGVGLFNLYASTQVFLCNVFLPLANPGMEWEYFELLPHRDIRFIDYGANEFELVMLKNEHYTPNVINTQMDGIDGYATSDLLSPHPTKPRFWKVVGRTDDQIMHSTGEKTNPGPLESILARDPHVRAAVIFGRARFHCGVIIEPSSEFAFDPSDTNKLVEYRNLIWPSIESMNAYAPSHSRIFKEMILVASPSKPFTYTAKGGTRRQSIIDGYADEISAAYDAVDESAQVEIAGPDDWSFPSISSFVRRIVEHTMKLKDRVLSDDSDLFNYGCDSLQATWIRNSILRILRDDHARVARDLSTNFIYENPTIGALSNLLFSKIQGGAEMSAEDIARAKRAELHALIQKYSADFPQFNAPSSYQNGVADGDTVLLTGSTGSFGANILATLISSTTVKKIYAMSRPSSSGVPILERHVGAFKREGLDAELLNNEKVQLLDADVNTDGFGVKKEVFDELQSSVTHIIHNGWRVDFNLAVASFESNIRGVRSLIDFSLGSKKQKPAKLIFISSIGVFLNYHGNRPAPEEPIETPDNALGQGYGESKWVSEKILEAAAAKTALKPTVVRLGQITGGPSGYWNEHEWLPSLIKSSAYLKMLPDAQGDVSWLTSEVAANALVDMRNTDVVHIHLIHPNPVPWSTIMSGFSDELGIPVVQFDEWVNALEQSQVTDSIQSNADVDAENKRNPAVRLLNLFRGAKDKAQDASKEPVGISRLSCVETVKQSAVLQNPELPQIGKKDVHRWVSYWKNSGFLA